MGQEVGNAFVTITPKLSNDFGSKIASGGAKDGADYGGKFGQAATKAIDAFSVAAGNLLSNAISAVASAAGETFQQVFTSYADYEQLVGGVDTLFKESSATVQAYAANAYKTAGMSANEYMEQVTSFSASLLQGLGGDTEAAAKYADMAMSDMSDNANKMGTDMSLITNAYQGFAKQNYMMLDNLNLGYGGTKTEMERLLADASKIAGVEFNIDNYDDVIEAIHVMQVEMGIAGTTAEEAEHTISGSLGMLKASWANFLAGVLNENADMGVLFSQLLDSIGAVVSNFVPRIGVLFVRLFQQLPQAALNAVLSLPDVLQPALAAVFGDGVAQTVTDNMRGAFEFIGTQVVPFVMSIVERIAPAVEAVGELVMGVMETTSQIVGESVAAIGQIVQDNWPTIQSIITSAMDIITNVMSVAWPIIQGIVTTVTNAIKGVVQVAWPAIQGIISTAVNAINGIIGGLSSIVGVVTGIFNAVKKAITDPIGTAKQIVQDAINTIKNIINGAHLELPHFKLPHFVINGGELPWGIGGQGRAPSINVEWYAQGGIIDGASLIGVGEAGPEMVLPQRGGLMDDFSEAVASRVDNQSVVDELRRFERMIGPIIADYAPAMTQREFNRAARTAVAYG